MTSETTVKIKTIKAGTARRGPGAKRLEEIFELLFAAYGPRGWWPVTAPGDITPCYSGGPKCEQQQLEVMIGAVLTQSTSWKNVEKALGQLQSRNLMSVQALSRVPAAKLASCIRSSGYFNEKAGKLKALAAFLKQHPLSALNVENTARLRVLLLDVHGIGLETADSILLYALGRPVFVIDAYTKRIFSRLVLSAPDEKYGVLQELFQKRLPASPALYNEYHALIVEHGKNVCRKKPVCASCCLRKVCAGRSTFS